ncbi:MAG: hypothetical protein AABY46_01415 [Nitrospirota bacterium]
MRKMILSAVILSFLFLPVLSGCESKQMKEENAKLKQQVDSLNQDKMDMQAQASQMAAKLDEQQKTNATLEKANADLNAKVTELQKKASKAAAKPAAKKKR